MIVYHIKMGHKTSTQIQPYKDVYSIDFYWCIFYWLLYLTPGVHIYFMKLIEKTGFKYYNTVSYLILDIVIVFTIYVFFLVIPSSSHGQSLMLSQITDERSLVHIQVNPEWSLTQFQIVRNLWHHKFKLLVNILIDQSCTHSMNVYRTFVHDQYVKCHKILITKVLSNWQTRRGASNEYSWQKFLTNKIFMWISCLSRAMSDMKDNRSLHYQHVLRTLFPWHA